MAALLLPMFPAFDTVLPQPGLRRLQQSFEELAAQFGTAAALCLIGLLLQAAVARTSHEGRTGRIAAGVRGALVAVLVAGAAGAPLLAEHSRLSIVVLAILLGLAEADARRRSPTTA